MYLLGDLWRLPTCSAATALPGTQLRLHGSLLKSLGVNIILVQPVSRIFCQCLSSCVILHPQGREESAQLALAARLRDTLHLEHLNPSQVLLPLHCAALHCAARHCATLHCAALHCGAMHCAVLHCCHRCSTTSQVPGGDWARPMAATVSWGATSRGTGRGGQWSESRYRTVPR